jgi:hypothetical protein
VPRFYFGVLAPNKSGLSVISIPHWVAGRNREKVPRPWDEVSFEVKDGEMFPKIQRGDQQAAPVDE